MTCVWIGPLKDTQRARFLHIRRWLEVIAAAFRIGGHVGEVLVNLRRAASDRCQRNFWHEGVFESRLKDDVVVVTTSVDEKVSRLVLRMFVVATTTVEDYETGDKHKESRADHVQLKHPQVSKYRATSW